jgi:hypothetical protein
MLELWMLSCYPAVVALVFASLTRLLLFSSVLNDC